MQVQSCASFPSEVCIVPSKNASSWEDDAPVDGSDGIEVVNETTTTILFNVNEDDEIYSVQVDPSPKAIKAFTKSDSTITTKKKAERTVKVSSSEDEEESASVTVQSKRKANAPKRPLASYMLFCKALRPKVVEENPDAKVPEIGQKLGNLWKKLTPDESAKYQKDADKLKEQYVKDKEIYEKNKVDVEDNGDGGDNSDGDEEEMEEEAPKTAKKKNKIKKDPLAPKRAQSAYTCTFARQRDQD